MFRKGSKGRNPHSWSSVIKPPQAEGQLGQRGKRREAGREASSNNTVTHGAMTGCIDREGPGGEAGSMWKRPGTDALCHSPIPGTQPVMQTGWVLLGMPSLARGEVRTCQGRGESEKASPLPTELLAVSGQVIKHKVSHLPICCTAFETWPCTAVGIERERHISIILFVIFVLESFY